MNNGRRQPSLLVPALIGGGVAGFVSSIPLVGALNCLCCSLVIGGGVLAAFLQSNNCQKAGVAFTAGSGALVGLVSAVFYAVVAAVVGSLVQVLMPMGDPAEMLEMMREQGVDLPPLVESFMRSMGGTSGLGLRIMIGFGVSLVVGAIFGTLGGLLGGLFFKYEPAPSTPAPPSTPPPPAPPGA